MNFKDFTIAFGQLPYDDLGFEYSGLVTKTWVLNLKASQPAKLSVE